MSGIVRAKFFCSDVDNPEGATAASVKLGAVCRGVENALWSQATPAGYITMNVLNTAAFEQFEKGAEYEVTFRRVEPPRPNDGHSIKIAEDKYGRLVCETCGATMGYTEEAVERQPHLKDYATEEKVAEYRALHDHAFGKKADAPA